ncbi:MAG: hypothetical protein IPK82_18150 [Polyangiaceae bacterium]|nr:hypothetical protein [Polyangiaceae bacterium]
MRLVRAGQFLLLLSLAACGQAAGSGVTPAPSATASTLSSGQTPLSSASAAAPSASAATPDPPPLPPYVPPSERPSAKVVPPKGIRAVEWKKIFDTYGALYDMDDWLNDIHRKYPSITRIFTLGKTHQGRNVQAILISKNPQDAAKRPAMLLNGAHHGDEPLSAEIVKDAIVRLVEGAESNPAVQRYLSELSIWCVPLVNPDGFSQFMTDFGAGRKNGRETRKPNSPVPLSAKGVDLNRNYPFRWGAHREAGSSKVPERRSYRGPSPASEPEAQGMIALSDREHFVGSISYHIGTVALLAPYTIDGVLQPKPNEAWLIAEYIAGKLPKINKRAVAVRKNLYTVDGTDQDYHRFAHGTLALLLESAARSWDSIARRDQTIEQIRPSWAALFDRYIDGPSVEGHVVNESGEPVSAKVDVAEVKTFAGEQWHSRCSDGFFGRYLPNFGKVTVRVSTPGSETPIETSADVTPEKGRAVVKIVVPGAPRSTCAPSAP